MESPVTARLLITTSTLHLLTGNEGQVISELRQVSGADIQLLHGEPIPNASDNDVVVQVQLCILYNSRQLHFFLKVLKSLYLLLYTVSFCNCVDLDFIII